VNHGAFLDRDGTINMDAGYVARPDELEFIPGAIEAIQLLNRLEYLVAVITIQGGVGHGFHTEADVHAFHEEMSRQLAFEGAHIDRFYYCPHHPEGSVEPYNVQCDCRKPGDALYRQAVVDLELDPTRCVAIGDKTTDLTPALALGATVMLLVPEERVANPLPEEESFPRAGNLRSAVTVMLGPGH